MSKSTGRGDSPAAQLSERNAAKQIHHQVMWTRLVAVVEEQAQALLRTAFGSVVREAGDLSAGVYDLQGRMLAQAVTGTPGHVNTMAMAVQHFLDRFEIQSMRDGDVFVSNDPWLGTGHLFDFVMVTPAFLHGEVVALFASTSHVTDVGGRGFTADATSIFEEGILIPHLKIRDQQGLNNDLLAIIGANSRNPVEVLGDIRSLISSNDVGVTRLKRMMAEFSIESLDDLASHIFEASETAVKQAISELPDGEFESSMTLDGYESAIEVKTRLTISGERLVLDYTGSSPASRYGINSPKCYTDAYSVFGLKCIIAPDAPNNHASLSCFEVIAEPGSCVAPQHPSPVTARHVIGQMLPDAVFGCLAQPLPDRVPAESAGSIWVLAMSGASGTGDTELDSAFNVMNVGLGGVGATPENPGLNTTAFPSGVGTIPLEVTELQSPLLYRRKEFIEDSGGAGSQPGGLSQRIEITNTVDADFFVSAATWDRLENPARGRNGGQDGRPGKAYLSSGAALPGKTLHRIPAGDGLVVELPGGGGYGLPEKRDENDLRESLAAGYVSSAAVQSIYKCNLPDED